MLASKTNISLLTFINFILIYSFLHYSVALANPILIPKVETGKTKYNNFYKLYFFQWTNNEYLFIFP